MVHYLKLSGLSALAGYSVHRSREMTSQEEVHFPFPHKKLKRIEEPDAGRGGNSATLWGRPIKCHFSSLDWFGLYGPKPTVSSCCERGEFRGTEEMRGSFEAAIRIPLRASSFLFNFNNLAFLCNPRKSLKFQWFSFSITATFPACQEPMSLGRLRQTSDAAISLTGKGGLAGIPIVWFAR